MDTSQVRLVQCYIFGSRCIPIPSAAPKSPSVAVSCTHLDMGSTGSPVRTEESNGAEPSSPKPVFATPLQPADAITNPSDHGINNHVPRAQSSLLADVVVNTPDARVIPISLTLPEPPKSQKSARPSIVPEITSNFTSTPAIDPATPNVVPEIFKVLVQCLRTHRSKGIEQPFWTDVAMELNKDKTTYAQAGVTSFKEYTVMAKRQGVIELGGQGEGAWIHLNLAYWHDIPSVIPTPPIGPSPDSLSLEESPSGERSSSDSIAEPPAQVPASASQLPPSDCDPIPSAGSAPSSDTIISSSPDVAPNSISPKPSQSLVATSTLVTSFPVVIVESNGHPPAPAPLSPALPELVTRAPPVVVPEIFKPLVICLQSYRSRGVLKPLRRNIATEINKNKATYKKAGVDRFNSYTALAKEQGIIEFSGKEEGVRVALKPKWYDAVIS
ncbi:hypothetical protein CPB84DRAFT_1293426 [Gymnopilus junonius]|uniref:Uncharacterized protein n=1 Tax=Gymnopilus junonius TaxID=109634 RepID=A0A9P5TKT6_GYMJU|nr:hypothetical protein CPB84DRAFT_1293426 [Gymnopilus junonius]